MAVIVQTVIFWVVTPQLIDTNILEEHAAYIFMVEVSRMGCGLGWKKGDH
jgi:hypothetical protein